MSIQLSLFPTPIRSQKVRIVRWRSHQRLGMHFLICPACERKFLKLFAALCSRGELHDATIAEAWIEQTEARHAAMRKPLDVRLIAFRDKLIRRYGLLFRRRRLVCRKCLGMRYGEVRRAKSEAKRPLKVGITRAVVRDTPEKLARRIRAWRDELGAAADGSGRSDPAGRAMGESHL